MILTNKTISIKRLTEVDWKKSYWSPIHTDVWVYIQPLSEEVIVNDENVSAYDWFKIMCSHKDLIIWDKITDNDWVLYKVKWVKIFDTIIDTHLEWIIVTQYD